MARAVNWAGNSVRVMAPTRVDALMDSLAGFACADGVEQAAREQEIAPTSTVGSPILIMRWFLFFSKSFLRSGGARQGNGAWPRSCYLLPGIDQLIARSPSRRRWTGFRPRHERPRSTCAFRGER